MEGNTFNEPARIEIPGEVPALLAAIMPLAFVFLVIGILWWHYSRKNRWEAAVKKQIEEARSAVRKSSGYDEEKSLEAGGKPELDGGGKGAVPVGCCELEQPGLREVDGREVFEVGGLEGVGTEIGGAEVHEMGGGQGVAGEVDGVGKDGVVGMVDGKAEGEVCGKDDGDVGEVVRCELEGCGVPELDDNVRDSEVRSKEQTCG
ncbi:hypothetical protein BU24DRAFT_461558 [Aaosphaeria arxii CBS 175.79]|uniref:Uncharacterized protein n=1 Tax=Aaosphaeria arxii CBS 175.79 TaxID=1450172 RepID=A0A6A5XQY2_9PLEO|nr:uncharacterized protein BU24DRAFT_461558 [Aaosphaeria arxii CBS 175.79]KAF2015306.1 hypothetical protein BU24DRAFT_461558 [Aaosphaeria arxii CBS 175.79]